MLGRKETKGKGTTKKDKQVNSQTGNGKTNPRVLKEESEDNMQCVG